MTGIPQDDAFAGGVKRESLSFKNAPIGTSFRGTVVETAKLIQSRDFDTNKPQFWVNGGKGKTVSALDDTGKPNNPAMSAVFALDLGHEERSVFAQKPSDLFSKFAEAQRVLGRPMGLGDVVEITLTAEEVDPDPTRAKKMNPKKIYAVTITPAPSDAFAAGATPDL